MSSGAGSWFFFSSRNFQAVYVVSELVQNTLSVKIHFKISF